MNYHMAIDMWSLGCIMAELYTGFPIFPGENEQEQLACIMEVLGIPDKDFVNRSSRRRLFFGQSHLFLVLATGISHLFDRPERSPSSRRELEGPPTAPRIQNARTGAPL